MQARAHAEAWRLKIARAEAHLSAFQALLRGVEAAPPYVLVPSREGNDVVIHVRLTGEVPADLPMTFGDVVHNARSALDLLVWEIAQRGEGTKGRPPNDREGRSLYFPVTRNRASFDATAERLRNWLAEEFVLKLKILQPWFMPFLLNGTQGYEPTDEETQEYVLLDELRRLTELDNWDKHRAILFSLWVPGSVNPDRTSQRRSTDEELAELEPVTDPETLRWLSELARAEADRPDAYDFYFAGEPLVDGSEFGRFIRHDRGLMPDIQPEGSLRLAVWEPGLTGERPGAPSAAALGRSLIDEARRACEFVLVAVPDGEDGLPI